MPKTLVLLSGGIDSLVAAYFLQNLERSLLTVFIDYGQKSAPYEKDSATKVSKWLESDHKEITVSGIGPFGADEIPCRNLMLISLVATGFSNKINEIAIGIHSGTPYFDCTEEFVNAASKLIARCCCDTGVSLIAPLASWSKAQVLKYAVSQNLPLTLTYSCESGELNGCGTCRSCLDRETLPC